MATIINSDEYQTYKRGKLIGRFRDQVSEILKKLSKENNVNIDIDSLNVKLVEQKMYSEGFEKHFLIVFENLPKEMAEKLKALPMDELMVITYPSDEE